MLELTPQRFVPGAPPPAPLSKSQKKKRKGKKPTDPATGATPGDLSPVSIPDATSAALTEKAPEPSDIQQGHVAEELVDTSGPVPQVEPKVPILPEEEVLLKPSPIVDLIHKRLKATTKKISRISVYASTDPEKLNDDQKRTLKTLPTLEAVQKELGEVKKAVEVHEAELVQELALKRVEAEKAEKQRISHAVSVAEMNILAKTSELLSFLRLRSLLSTGQLDGSNLDDTEGAALFAAYDVLLGEDEDAKNTVLSGFLTSPNDEFNGTTYARLLEITEQRLNPPHAPTPVQEPHINGQEQVDETPVPLSATTEPDVAPVAGAIPSNSSSFHFMQESELETPSSFEDGVEWVERADALGHEEEPQVEVEVTSVTVAVEEQLVNGHVVSATQEIVVTADVVGQAIDWAADDEGGLPSIAGLHATFGTSGSATPVAPIVEETQPHAPVAPVTPVNGGVAHTQEDPDDGFIPARTGRGGRGGNRGWENRGGGGFRGGERGFRGGHRGGERGERGAHRGGGDRGRGGFRGGDRGGERGGFHRGRGSGSADWRGVGENGETRARGRGRGRGGPPPNPTPA